MLEALDLVLGADRLSRQSPIDDDFHKGMYLPPAGLGGPTQCRCGGTTVHHPYGDDHRAFRRTVVLFREELLRWNTSSSTPFNDPANLDAAPAIPALRVTFIGRYDPDEDDFEGLDDFFTVISLIPCSFATCLFILPPVTCNITCCSRSRKRSETLLQLRNIATPSIAFDRDHHGINHVLVGGMAWAENRSHPAS
jgi:hypothetical protein